MNRPSIIAVTEKGKTRYGVAATYGDLADIALRLIKNELDGKGNYVPMFQRLHPICEINRREYEGIYANHPEKADDFASIADIDVDLNLICIDEDREGAREYSEIAIDALLDAARPLIHSTCTGREEIEKEELYRCLESVMC